MSLHKNNLVCLLFLSVVPLCGDEKEMTYFMLTQRPERKEAGTIH